MASSNGQTESSDTTGTGIETVEVKDAAKKQTAAEKFDLVPPWCVVKTGRENSPSWCVRETVTPADGLGKYAGARGRWCSGDWFNTEPEARRIARLTRPLDSWEPAPDCALPVEGWQARRCATGPGWFVAALGDNSIFSVSGAANKRFDTRRAAIVWAWTEAPAPEERKPITDGTGATDGLEARVSKVEGVLARICPEADSQTDGKGRTLVQINRELDAVTGWMNDDARPEFDAIDKRADAIAGRVEYVCGRVMDVEAKLERLIAAHVPVPAKVNVRSDAASTNEAMTEAAASDEGWREMLVTRSFDGGFSAWLFTPSASHFVCGSGEWSRNNEDLEPRKPAPDTDKTAKERRTCKPPPNLAEWWKPGAKADTLADIRGAIIDAVYAAVPTTYHVGTDVAAGVRNLASAHEQALKDMAEYRTALDVANHTSDSALTDLGALRGALWLKPDADGADMVNAVTTLRSELAAAQTAATAAEGRAATATKRASEAESKLADARAALERVQRELAETNALLNKAIDSAETPS